MERKISYKQKSRPPKGGFFERICKSRNKRNLKNFFRRLNKNGHIKNFPTGRGVYNSTSERRGKIEIPADVYDIAVHEGKIAVENFIRGDYDYETAKILAQSGCIDALKFNITGGEIKNVEQCQNFIRDKILLLQLEMATIARRRFNGQFYRG